jgi:hypothetical protein
MYNYAAGNFFAMGPYFALFGLAIIWSLVWKGLALWRAAQKNNHAWFIILLVVNTLGILEILYLYVFSRMEKGKNSSSAKKFIK